MCVLRWGLQASTTTDVGYASARCLARSRAESLPHYYPAHALGARSGYTLSSAARRARSCQFFLVSVLGKP